MSTMRAAVIDRFGDAGVLEVRQIAVPVPGPNEVLVQVRAAGVQLTDTAIRSGWTPPGAVISFPQILGNEFAGVVAAAGEAVQEFAVGDEVLGFRLLGCYAEFVAVPQSQVVAKPLGLDWTVAGVLSASGQTAHTAIGELDVAEDDTVLVHGAAGGVGTVFTQLAVALGARVIGTAASTNHDYLRGLGAIPVAYGPGQVDRIRREAPAGVDVAFDAAGHDNLRDAVDLVPNRHRVATIVDMALAAELGCKVIRSDRSERRLADLVDRVAKRTLTIHVRRTYDLTEISAAHRDVETGHGRGKIALIVSEDQ